jgi:hypothetical protein
MDRNVEMLMQVEKALVAQKLLTIPAIFIQPEVDKVTLMLAGFSCDLNYEKNVREILIFTRICKSILQKQRKLEC